MSGDDNYYKFTDLESANAVGLDPEHTMEHMIETVLCAARGNTRVLDSGFYFQFRDAGNRTWTLSVIPEDGGVITDALLKEVMEDH
jgi:hypothetical protein